MCMCKREKEREREKERDCSYQHAGGFLSGFLRCSGHLFPGVILSCVEHGVELSWR